MSKQEAKGSIVLELIILILVAALVAVILIPGKIWKEQEQEKKTAHYNMMSIYEAEKYYKKLTGKFTTDPAELINTVRSDSNLIRKQKVVNYTRELMRNFNNYLASPYIKHIARIKKNIDQIVDDIESNNYHFRTIDEINNEANELKIQLGNFENSPEYPEFVRVLNYIDSLLQVRQTISDNTLQVNALKIAYITDSLQVYLKKVNPVVLKERWAPLSDRLEKFIKMIKHSELVRVTSVADRLEDFKKRVDDSFNQLQNIDINTEVEKINVLRQRLDEMYQRFLKDYNITSQLALNRLPEADSLIIHLTETNFYSPINDQRYKMIFDQDSQFVKIESPVLLDELKEKAQPIVDEINNLPFLNLMGQYVAMTDSVLKKANLVRRNFRKNTDLFIVYKELEDLQSRYQNLSIMEAYRNLADFVEITPKCESYSRIKELVEKGLTAAQIYDQVYAENVFTNLDSLHSDVQKKLNEFNELLLKIKKRNRRAKIETFEGEQRTLDSLLTAFKNAKDDQLLNNLKKIEKQLEDLYVFASEGKKIRVYGIFDKEIKNFGYIYKDVRSWEEEKKK
ncbi:MAG: hypothetical protein GXO77_17710 [Calditrichaeota bacterium]|nr:hypothetical protein [Calditrichota bacterium]